MEWLLTTLERGERYPLEEWPKAIAEPSASIPGYLEPVDSIVWTAPRVSAGLPEGEENGRVDDEVVDEVVSVWAHNRSCIQVGWLCPSS